MKTTFAHTILLVLTLAVGHAEAGFDAAGRARAIAPFLDEVAVAVARVDFTRVDAGPLVDKLSLLIPESKSEARAAGLAADAWVKAFRLAGGRDAYVVVSLIDAPPEPWFLIVPLHEGAKEEALKMLLGQGLPGIEVTKRLGGALFAGRRRTLARLESLEPDPRPELAPAFEAAGDTAAQVLLLPPKHTHRVVDEMMPRLPEKIGGGPSSVLTRGVAWAALGADASPQLRLRLVVQSDNAEAAAALQGELAKVCRLLGADKELLAELPRFDDFVKLLMPTVQADRLVLELDEKRGTLRGLFDLVKPALETARGQAARVQSMNNLKQIGLAMHCWHDDHKGLPAPASYDAQGKPLLSWRVHLLPLVGQEQLYKQFHLNEAWDGPHNRTLIDKMPAIYRSPGCRLPEQGRTSYVAPVGRDTVFAGREGMALDQIKDGTSNTILVVEVGDPQAVIWTAPEDLPFDPEQPAKGLGGPFKGGFLAVFCDGSVQFLPLPQDAKNLRSLFTPAAGERASR